MLPVERGEWQTRHRAIYLHLLACSLRHGVSVCGLESCVLLACFWILLCHWRRNSSWASRVYERLGTPTQTSRMISRHIVIWNLYYNPRIAGRFQFTTSVFAILVDDCLLYYAVTKIMEWIFGEQQRDSGHGLDSGTESVGAKKFDPFDNEMRTPVRASDAGSAMADNVLAQTLDISIRKTCLWPTTDSLLLECTPSLCTSKSRFTSSPHFVGRR